MQYTLNNYQNKEYIKNYNRYIKTNDCDVDLFFPSSYYFTINQIITYDPKYANKLIFNKSPIYYDMPLMLTDPSRIIDIPYYSGLSNPYKFKMMIPPLISEPTYYLQDYNKVQFNPIIPFSNELITMYSSDHHNSYKRNNLNLSSDFYFTKYDPQIKYELFPKSKVLIFDTKKSNTSFILENSKVFDSDYYDKN